MWSGSVSRTQPKWIVSCENLGESKDKGVRGELGVSMCFRRNCYLIAPILQVFTLANALAG